MVIQICMKEVDGTVDRYLGVLRHKNGIKKGFLLNGAPARESGFGIWFGLHVTYISTSKHQVNWARKSE